MGNYTTRRDTKGRLSVPAPFRSAMKEEAPDAPMKLVLRSSHTLPCIEAWPASTFDEFAARFVRMDLFSSDTYDLATTLYAEAWRVEPDKEGRMIVPDSLVRHAGLTDTVFFFGLGNQFQIWEPEAGERRIAEARRETAARKLTLPGLR